MCGGLTATMPYFPKIYGFILRDLVGNPHQQVTLREYYKVNIEKAVEIAKRNALFWAHHIPRVYLLYLERFSEVVLQWVAPRHCPTREYRRQQTNLSPKCT